MRCFERIIEIIIAGAVLHRALARAICTYSVSYGYLHYFHAHVTRKFRLDCWCYTEEYNGTQFI